MFRRMACNDKRLQSIAPRERGFAAQHYRFMLIFGLVLFYLLAGREIENTDRTY